MFIKKYGDVAATTIIPAKANIKIISFVIALYFPLINYIIQNNITSVQAIARTEVINKKIRDLK